MTKRKRTLSAFDAQLEVLASGKRRHLLFRLRRDHPCDVLDVGDAGSRTSSETDHLTSMHHVHLPKLEQHGLVDWERGSDTVRKGPAFGEIEPLLEVLDEHRDTLRAGIR